MHLGDLIHIKFYHLCSLSDNKSPNINSKTHLCFRLKEIVRIHRNLGDANIIRHKCSTSRSHKHDINRHANPQIAEHTAIHLSLTSFSASSLVPGSASSISRLLDFAQSHGAPSEERPPNVRHLYPRGGCKRGGWFLGELQRREKSKAVELMLLLGARWIASAELETAWFMSGPDSKALR